MIKINSEVLKQFDKDGIMRKDSTTAKLTEYKIKRNKKISKVRYIACPVAYENEIS